MGQASSSASAPTLVQAVVSSICPLAIRRDLVAVGLGIQVVAHLDEESHVLIGAETRIQAELCFDRFRVGGILLLKTKQALVQGSELGLLVAVLGHGLVQPALGLHPD